jgi:adenine-specific DNA-methyltransferase
MGKLAQAIGILTDLGFPPEQQNERSAYTLLALLDLKPNEPWNTIQTPIIGVTPIMQWILEVYSKSYAPNSRETVRRSTLHQFIDGGICLYNPDKPDRPVNSPKTCYQIAPEVLEVLKCYGSSKWDKELRKWLSNRKTLTEKYAMQRNLSKIPVTLSNGLEVHLSPGDHSKLIRDIVEDFAPRFIGGAEVVYLGDTGAKDDCLDEEKLESLGVIVDRKGKLPDVVMYLQSEDWLVLIESVTSHGPIDGKRYSELNDLFNQSTAGLVFVSAFPDRATMNKFLTQISWETEVWVADSPTHMIHFNGDKFFGPHQ